MFAWPASTLALVVMAAAMVVETEASSTGNCSGCTAKRLHRISKRTTYVDKNIMSV